MKKQYLKIAVLSASTLAFTAGNAAAADLTRAFGDQEMKVKFFGFTQVTAEAGDGLKKSETDNLDGLRFGADRVRFGFKANMDKVFAKLQVDFQKSDDGSKTGQMDEIIKDAEVGYKFMNELSVKVGEFKTPVGMDFNVSGKKLDITKRGMEKKLVLERSLGAMVSGRKIGDMFSYDIGVFNPANRSSAVSDGVLGDGLAYAARVMFDLKKTLHAEVSYGSSEEAGGAGTEDYSVWDAALSYIWQDLTLKAEYISGEDIKGVTGADEEVWYLHAGYRFNPMFEGVVRHYQADNDLTDKDLGNTYIGLNIFLNEKKKFPARIQLNYVVTSGDDGFINGYSGTTKGFLDDVFLAQFQAAF
jgi:hypothetical protein